MTAVGWGLTSFVSAYGFMRQAGRGRWETSARARHLLTSAATNPCAAALAPLKTSETSAAHRPA